MEKRHYFTQEVDIDDINTIFRTISEGKVTGYSINETIDLLLGNDEYKLNIVIHTNEPDNWKGKVIERSDTEVWTKDGIYLNKKDDGIYIKDFFEDIPEKYQELYYNELFNSDTEDFAIIEKMAKDIISNAISPKEFLVLQDGKGIEDNVVANIEGLLYVDSNNYYYPHLNNGDVLLTDWIIPSGDYGELTGSTTGRSPNLYLESNKLLYILNHHGLTDTPVKYLNQEDGPLEYLRDITIDHVRYQIYINVLYMYKDMGNVSELEWEDQVIKVKNIFSHDDLKGKLVKVW